MHNKINQLSFIIGAFFILVSIVLLTGYLFSNEMAKNINLYSGIALFIFGFFMTQIKASE